MDVDYTYRIVAALEGRHVFLEKVGLHDPTERWAEAATLLHYEDHVRVSAETFRGAGRPPAQPVTEALFEEQPSLAQIAASDAVAEILTDCLPGVLEGWSDGTIEDWMSSSRRSSGAPWIGRSAVLRA